MWTAGVSERGPGTIELVSPEDGVSIAVIRIFRADRIRFAQLLRALRRRRIGPPKL